MDQWVSANALDINIGQTLKVRIGKMIHHLLVQAQNMVGLVFTTGSQDTKDGNHVPAASLDEPASTDQNPSTNGTYGSLMEVSWGFIEILMPCGRETRPHRF